MNLKEICARVLFRIRNQGILSLIGVILKKSYEIFFPPRSKYLNEIQGLISTRKGLEIGGPSKVFTQKGFIPLYPSVSHLDNMNFASDTIWEGEIRSTLFIAGGRQLGSQYIGEASDLSQIKDSQYDFLLSSEMIQHIANPLKALYEWKRVLAEKGVMVLIIPNMTKTFDHNRPLTALQHLIEDYDNKTGEADLTHLEEALKYHDLSMDRPAGSYEQFRKRSEKNFRFRALHHHVFTQESARELVEYAGFRVLTSELFRSTIIMLLGK
jgi:hypothetical protein